MGGAGRGGGMRGGGGRGACCSGRARQDRSGSGSPYSLGRGQGLMVVLVLSWGNAGHAPWVFYPEQQPSLSGAAAWASSGSDAMPPCMVGHTCVTSCVAAPRCVWACGMRLGATAAHPGEGQGSHRSGAGVPAGAQCVYQGGPGTSRRRGGGGKGRMDLARLRLGQGLRGGGRGGAGERAGPWRGGWQRRPMLGLGNEYVPRSSP